MNKKLLHASSIQNLYDDEDILHSTTTSNQFKTGRRPPQKPTISFNTTTENVVRFETLHNDARESIAKLGLHTLAYMHVLRQPTADDDQKRKSECATLSEQTHRKSTNMNFSSSMGSFFVVFDNDGSILLFDQRTDSSACMNINSPK
jgi:hypothetical protein